MYKISSYKLEEHEVVKQTEKQVVFLLPDGREIREAKITSYDSWHNTKEEAIAFEVELKQKEIERHLNSIEYLKSEIEKIKHFQITNP